MNDIPVNILNTKYSLLLSPLMVSPSRGPPICCKLAKLKTISKPPNSTRYSLLLYIAITVKY